MQLSEINKKKGTRVLYVNGEQCLVAERMRLLSYENFKKTKTIATLPVPIVEKLFSYFTFTRLGFRLGIHMAMPLVDGRILAVLKRRIVLVEKNGNTKIIDKIHRGNKPAARGICQLPDGKVIYGEYLLNKKRDSPVGIYRSTKIEEGFEKIYEFSAGVIRHIHFIQWDSYESCLWMGTGDSDEESSLYKSDDYGLRWIKVGGGSQRWRAVSIIILKDYLYWGTDAGSDAGTTPNYIICFNKKTKKIYNIQKVQGPCHGSGILSDGTMIISTGVEGGINEKDNSAHLWVSNNGNNWIEIYSKEKNIWPHIIQYGVMRIPRGSETSYKLHYTSLALNDSGEAWCSFEIKNIKKMI
jgi:hypothetical protein